MTRREKGELVAKLMGQVKEIADASLGDQRVIEWAQKSINTLGVLREVLGQRIIPSQDEP